MATSNLSPEDQEFLARCEEELKDRFTEKDEAFMKVYNAEASTPPIIENWWSSQNSGRRNDRRHQNRQHPYDRYGSRGGGYNRRDNYGGRDHYGGRDNYNRRDYHDRRNNYDSRERGGQGSDRSYQRPRYY